MNMTTNLATGSASLDGLRSSAAKDPKAAIKETARQFEALFMNEIMKSMRATTMGSGMLDNGGTELGQNMLDQQYATQMTGRPGGLADMIARQLERQMGGAFGSQGPQALQGLPARPKADAAATPAPDAVKAKIPQKAVAEEFVRTHGNAAAAASAETGIPAPFILAQAAHESGWGRKEILNADGSTSFNLFGVKAGAGWKGATAEVTTTEYVDGQARKVKEKFRAYGSYDESFRDWARMLKQSSRYAQVLEAAGAGAGNGGSAGDAQAFAQGLQRAGYATDPQYADKLGRVINTTLRLQRPAV